MSDLTDFLLARIAEDEGDADEMWEDDYISGHPEPGTWWKWVRDECEAKREVVGWHGESLEHNACRTLRTLALPYADHPDYREEWQP